MNPVTRQILLAHESNDLPIRHQASSVKQAAAMPDWQPQRDDDVFCFWDDFGKYFERRSLHAGRVKGILATVTGDAKFG